MVSRAIFKSWKHLGDWVTETYNAALEQGRQPASWKRAIVAVIHKPGKTNYTTRKAYRPISLLVTLGKGLEQVVSDQLPKHGNKPGSIQSK